MTRVWPALWPPWKRTTMSACSDNQSTILPFPSSPHWAPTTTTLAIREFSLQVIKRQAKTRPRPLACEAFHRITDERVRGKQERPSAGALQSHQTLDISRNFALHGSNAASFAVDKIRPHASASKKAPDCA